VDQCKPLGAGSKGSKRAAAATTPAPGQRKKMRLDEGVSGAGAASMGITSGGAASGGVAGGGAASRCMIDGSKSSERAGAPTTPPPPQPKRTRLDKTVVAVNELDVHAMPIGQYLAGLTPDDDNARHIIHRVDPVNPSLMCG